MITALNIEDHTKKGIKGAFSLFRRNRIRVEHTYCDTAAVKSVTYELRRGEVNWSALDRFIKGQRGRLLCPEGIELPSGSGYKRFESRELDRRLCENAAIFLLGEVKDMKVDVVLIDKSGELAPFCSYLVDHPGSLRVVTENSELYLEEADRILEERGAVIRICSAANDLFDADLIVAPDGSDIPVRCGENAVLLFGVEPTAPVGARAVYRYSFGLHEKLRKIKPDYLDDGYFASALYSLAGVHSLGSSVFNRCSDGEVLHTRKSLVEKLKTKTEESRADV